MSLRSLYDKIIWPYRKKKIQRFIASDKTPIVTRLVGILELVNSIPDQHLMSYKFRYGMKKRINSGFDNANEVLTIISKINNSITTGGDLSKVNSLLFVRDTKSIVLDEWLTTKDNYPIDPLNVKTKLQSDLLQLQMYLSSVTDNATLDYYQRKLFNILHEICAVLEALLIAAENVNDRQNPQDTKLSN
jgi:hypothetical protein